MRERLTGDAEEPNESAAQRLLAGRRMQKSRAMFDDPWTPLSLATSLCLLHVLEELVGVLFETSDLKVDHASLKDRHLRLSKKLQPSQKRVLEARAAESNGQSGKHAAILATFSFLGRIHDIVVGEDVNVCAIPLGFAPSGQQEAALKKVRGGLLRAASSVFYRLSTRHRVPPDVLVTAAATEDAAHLQKVLDELDQWCDCCLDVGCSRPLKQFLSSQPCESRATVLKHAVSAWSRACRTSTLGEESAHASMKKHVTGKAKGTESQIYNSVTSEVSRIWRDMGNRDLSVATDDVACASTFVKSKTYHKPAALGRLDWSYRKMMLTQNPDIKALPPKDPQRVEAERLWDTQFANLTGEEREAVVLFARAEKAKRVIAKASPF